MGVIFHTLNIIMLASVNFNDQLCRRAVKVNDIAADNALLEKFYRVFAQEEIPKFTFVGCHFSSQAPCIFRLSLGMLIV